MIRRFLIALAALATIAAHAQSDDASHVRDTVHLTGLVDRPLLIHPGNVATFPVQGVDLATDVTCADGEVKRTIRQARGILLRDLLDSAGVQLEHKKARGEYLVYVAASDDYNVIFSWNELRYGPAGEHTWLLFEEDGKPLLENGRFIIFCTSDVVTGPRHVKWVEEISVRR